MMLLCIHVSTSNFCAACSEKLSWRRRQLGEKLPRSGSTAQISVSCQVEATSWVEMTHLLLPRLGEQIYVLMVTTDTSKKERDKMNLSDKGQKC